MIGSVRTNVPRWNFSEEAGMLDGHPGRGEELPSLKDERNFPPREHRDARIDPGGGGLSVRGDRLREGPRPGTAQTRPPVRGSGLGNRVGPVGPQGLAHIEADPLPHELHLDAASADFVGSPVDSDPQLMSRSESSKCQPPFATAGKAAT